MLFFIGMWINCTTTIKLTILRICPTLVNPNHPSYLLYPTDEGVDNLLARDPGGNCIKIGLTGKSILRDYFQENMTSRRPFLLLRIRFPGRPVFIQFVPGWGMLRWGIPCGWSRACSAPRSRRAGSVARAYCTRRWTSLPVGLLNFTTCSVLGIGYAFVWSLSMIILTTQEVQSQAATCQKSFAV